VQRSGGGGPCRPEPHPSWDVASRTDRGKRSRGLRRLIGWERKSYGTEPGVLIEHEPLGGFEEFYRAHFDMVVRATYVVVGDREEAFDIAQEAFARTWGRWGEVGERERPLLFTLAVARNLARSQLRRLIRGRHALSSVAHPDPEWEDDRTLTALAVRDVLRRLPTRQRWALVVSDLLGLPSEEAARVLGVRPSTVRVHLARARTRMREELAKVPERRILHRRRGPRVGGEQGG
jgi:RNA polymerase sigma-70 factor, ECF subfamily